MKAISPEVSFPAVERDLLEAWDREGTFKASNEQRKSAKEFAFYDGPPFANGLPHYGHLLANSIKDTVPRYWNMRGHYVDRRFGWDCHGLPVEFEIEKRDGLKGRQDIVAMGIGTFNEKCRESVMHYQKEWQKTITRLGRWVDWGNQYRTMDKDFMESVWWVFSELNRRGLVYRGYKVVPYSPRITAVLSNFEANQNYKDVQDPAVTVKFRLKNEKAYLLAWTTTPWTLISNLALAVGPEIDYVKIQDSETNEEYYLAEARLESVYKKAAPKKGAAKEAEAQPELYKILGRMKGSELVGKSYEPLFPYFAGRANSFKVFGDAYVSTDDGTGIVHQAPAYGEDDFRVCNSNGIELVDPLDDEGRFKDTIPEYSGQFCKDADKEIIKRLKTEGKLLRHDTIVHSYPFCERTDTPLIYRAIPAWYVAVEKIVPKLVANNQKINWVPGHLRDGRMGKWLENARDWAVSRNRFWGTPLPIWVSEKDRDYYEVIGSVEELQKKTGKTIDDLHKHHIDNLTWEGPAGKGTMRRVPEVFDCWFESGSMPYAQQHYPFANKDKFNAVFPADFIAEGLDQTRGWFYTLQVLSTALFDRPAFKNVVVNGIICDETGRKMSKRHRNYTAPDLLLEKFGADSVRLYMINSPILRGEDLIFSDKGVMETTRAVILPLWNAHSFLTTYATADGWQPSPELVRGVAPPVDHEMDRWIISRLQTVAARVHEQMEDYRLYAVVPVVLEFIEDLTNWYIRLSRRRFWGAASGADADADSDSVGEAGALSSRSESTAPRNISADTAQAYSTLFYVLTQFSKLFAPFAPFVSDRIYRNLADGVTGVPASVHLCDMPMPAEKLIDRELETRMDLVRRATLLGRSLRAKHQIKTRQVLPSILVITRNGSDREIIARGAGILKEELNLKEVQYSNDEAQFVRLSVKPNLRTLGKRLGGALNVVRKELEALSSAPDKVVAMLAELDSHGKVAIAGHDLVEEDFLIERGPKDERLIATGKGVTVLLDTRLSEDLILEGLAREVISRIQRLRKESGLQVSDRIKLKIGAKEQLAKAVTAHKDYIAGETLATSLDLHSGLEGMPKGKARENFELDGGVNLSVDIE